MSVSFTLSRFSLSAFCYGVSLKAFECGLINIIETLRNIDCIRSTGGILIQQLLSIWLERRQAFGVAARLYLLRVLPIKRPLHMNLEK